jgi:hypothetical protein
VRRLPLDLAPPNGRSGPGEPNTLVVVGGAQRIREVWVAAVLGIVLATVTAWPPSPAVAQHTKLSLESIGPNGGNGAQSADLVGVRKAGKRAFIRTAEPLVGEDTDSSLDLYERTSGGTALLSSGPLGGNGAFPANFGDAVGAGSTVLFQTQERLVADDTDTYLDVYRRDGPSLVRASFGPQGGNGSHDAYLAHATENSGHIFITTREALVSSDTDSSLDIYQRVAGDVTLVSTGPGGGNGDAGVTFRSSSGDGDKVFFETTESLVGADTDVAQDIYERSGGTTRLLSTGPNGGNGDHLAVFGGTSGDGSRVFFTTAESLVAADTDAGGDVYERSGSTTTIHSIGPSGGNSGHSANLRGISANGARVFFETAEQLDTTTDRDGRIDVYESAGGAVTLLTPGGRSAASDAAFVGTSSDGTRVFVQTEEKLTAADTDDYQDIYVREAGALTLLSTGPAGGSGPTHAYFAGGSGDGTRVFMETVEPLVAADADSRTDVYERHAGVTTLLSSGPTGGNGAHDATFRTASADGTRVFLRTAEALVPADTDTSRDVYSASVPGTVTVRLDAVPDGPQDFSFSATGLSPPTFQLDDDLDPALTNTQVFSDVTPGAGYSVSQSAPSGWSLAGAQCDDGSPPENIDVDAGEHVTCTFVNSRGYPRPISAPRVQAPLVVAYRECTSPNRTHGPPLTGPSCNPPSQSSDFLTVGPTMTGSVRFAVTLGNPNTPADEADVRIYSTAVDVRRKTTLDDYTGQLEGRLSLRITDRLNGPGMNETGTVADVPFTFTVPCTTTAEPPDVGATCSVDTSADAVLAGAAVESKRTIWQVADIELRDGGPDGVASTQDNTVFLREGLFVP